MLDCARSEHLTLLLDVDGTLIPFAESPEEAVLDRAGVNLLDALAFSGIQVVLVSGRPRELVECLRVSVPGLWCSAEHGAWWRHGDEWEGPPIDHELDTLAATMHALEGISGVRIERKSLGLCVHWRRVTLAHREIVIAETRQAFAAWLAARSDYEELAGVETLEVRHRSATKAVAVHRVRRLRPACRLMALGDDETDEDMFALLESGDVGIRVRNRRPRATTRAMATLTDSVAVRDFLWSVVNVRRSRDT